MKPIWPWPTLKLFASEILSVRKSDASSKPVAIYRHKLPRWQKVMAGPGSRDHAIN
jgi:hypothetical protein